VRAVAFEDDAGPPRIAGLTDARVNGIAWLKQVQCSVLKDLCAACRQGDPDLKKEIGVEKLSPGVRSKVEKIDEVLAVVSFLSPSLSFYPL